MTGREPGSSIKNPILRILLVCIGLVLIPSKMLWGNPWNGKVVLQAFWWDSWNENYPQGWYTYLAKLAPRLRAMGLDGIWIPSPAKGNAGVDSMGYDLFDHYDLGEKDQKGTVATRFGDKDSLLRLIAVAHANGLEVYLDIVLNHVIGGGEDPEAPGDKFKKFRYVGFSGPQSGRWAKDHWNFHPNPDHGCTTGDWCEQLFGPDICYLDAAHGGGGNGQYMRDKAREWFVWLTKQTGADGFRFDAVKHYPAYVVEDLLYHAMGNRIDYFAVGEFVGSQQQLDTWASHTQNRAGTFDFALREALADIVEAGGYFDMGSLPNFQQKNRMKTVPFINNHDTWRGVFWDSEPGSNKHDDRSGDWRKNDAELAPTIDPDNPRADVAYAAAFAVDGSPMIYYEDIFENSGPERFRADPRTLPVRPYLVNLIWAHQKLDFKDGAYKVRYQGSPDLLVIERSGKAMIGLNDHGSEWVSAWVQTDFGPHAKLHDYSGSTPDDLETDDHGWVEVSVPPMAYGVWGPVGITGGFAPQGRRTVQEFQLDDDLGDSRASSLRFGGKLRHSEYRTAGSVWVAPRSAVKVWLYTEGERRVALRIDKPDTNGAKSNEHGHYEKNATASNSTPVYLEVTAEREGYHQLSARIIDTTQSPTRAYLKVEYEAPATSEKF
jgi:alpha-amylase